MSLNTIVIEGRVGSDPVMERRGDQDFTKFLIYHGQGKQEFKITAVAWGKMAGVCVKYLRTGMRGVNFQGRLEGNEYSRGDKKYTFYEIVIELVHFPPLQPTKKKEEEDLPF